ncbi:MAG TPA: deoxyribose-phosphate aldolase [Chryseosolibacter sp.]|nr:deoxyribose-phosphate aldolase [Chryseosolibacter sp.]
MNIARHIEHTNLSSQLTISDIDKLVDEARQFGFLGVCVPPFWVRRAFRERGNSKIILVTVAGFPLGYNMTETKIDEIRRAIDNGADEIDLVWNVTSFKTGIPWTKIEVAKCAKLTHDYERLLKVIIETAYLTDREIEQACKICADAGADFVKTSTGFAPQGAEVEQVKLMRESLPAHVGVKASGGIKTYEQALAMLHAGADRIGTSSGISILENQKTK